MTKNRFKTYISIYVFPNHLAFQSPERLFFDKINFMENLNLKTKDKTNIAINHYKNSKEEVIIVCPGWCMTKDSKSFLEICESFSKDFDVICLDFRGSGKSSGFYTFTAKETLDLECVVQYAKKYYKKIHLVGFSLGGAVCNIYASCSDCVDKVIVVSAPSEFSKIENQMWKKAAWGETIKKFELGRFLSIRPCVFPLKKIKPIDVIENVKSPTLFIAGEKDPTVHFWHTEELYKKAKCKKEYKLFKGGYHAEDLFLHFKDDFLKVCFEWLLF